jgi:uncharacterized membrane protein YeaQ/YmgE (transglycosylase-associated protein family)
MASLIERAIGAARLDAHTYEDVEADPTAFGQAMTVVVVAAVAGGIGSTGIPGEHGTGLIGGTIASLVGWFVSAFTVYLVGTRVLPMPQTKADLGQLLRTTGFAASPGIVRALASCLDRWIGARRRGPAALAAMVVAVRPHSTTEHRWPSPCACHFRPMAAPPAAGYPGDAVRRRHAVARAHLRPRYASGAHAGGYAVAPGDRPRQCRPPRAAGRALRRDAEITVDGT